MAWQAEAGVRWAELAVPHEGRTGFTRLAPEATGITFTNHLAEATVALNRIPENGSGVALGDVDGDGWCDIYFCRLEGDNALYRNLGNWRFEEITQAAGVACPDQYSTGTVLADLDGDGDLDLLVNAIGGGTRAFLNDGRGHFTELTGTRLVRRFGATSLALADIDGDGDLDLYVTNYRTTTYQDRPPGLKVEARTVDGKIVVTPEDRFIPLMPRAGGVEVWERGERDFLYLNDGAAHYLPVSWTSGAFLDADGQPLKAPPADWGLSVMLRDLNGDGLPDIYVCNDFFYSRDQVWFNEGGKQFRAPPRTAWRKMSVSSMSIDVADINRDGLDDLFVTDMVSRDHAWRQRQRPNLMKGMITQPHEDPEFSPEVVQNTLFLNRGDGTYAEIAYLSGVDASEWSWGAAFLDVDLDGYEDLLVSTGNNHDSQDADAFRAAAQTRQSDSLEVRLTNWRRFPPLLTPLLAFRNNHDLTFTETGPAWGFTEPGAAQGMAFADLDLDGDLDLVVNRLNGAAALYRNEVTAARLAVRLHGAAKNTRGIGARIKVLGGPAPQSQEMVCGGRYLSGDDSMRVFAAGAGGKPLRLEVTWRSGKRSVVERALPNRVYEVDEAAAAAAPPATPPAAPAPFFRDVSALLAHEHEEEVFDDFQRQPLLSRKLSQLGPGVAWFDVNGDGWEDLILGAGRGGRLAVFQNDTRGGFVRLTNAPLDRPLTRDATTILGWPRGSGERRLLLGLASYEDGATNRTAVQRLDLAAKTSTDLLPDSEASVGPLALADVDGDGELDLFIGGRVIPGRYPQPASSRLYRGQGGAFVPDVESTATLKEAGLVSGAVFSDLDGDGLPELLLACDWGPLRVYRNVRGRLTEWAAPLAYAAPPTADAPGSGSNARPATLRQLTGWWNAVSTGDLDGDGRPDIIAANWGRNTRFQRYLARALRVYYGDFAGAGITDLIETYYAPALAKWVPWRDYDTMAKALPFFLEHVPSFGAYGSTGVEELLEHAVSKAHIASAAALDSLVLLNRGDHFAVAPLPVEAQFAPAFGVAVGDFDGDGREDVFLSQNFFDLEEETSRYDAGVGLWLRGDGQGGFRALGAQESGVRVFGEQRGCALADYDRDGRLDLVVTQNRHATRLYQNTRGRPGLRVALRGPPGNLAGVGASLRLRFGDRWGPAHEVRAGGGYWSQDSLVALLATPAPPTQISVRWPGGKLTTLDVPAGAREVEVTPDGALSLRP